VDSGGKVLATVILTQLHQLSGGHLEWNKRIFWKTSTVQRECWPESTGSMALLWC